MILRLLSRDTFRKTQNFIIQDPRSVFYYKRNDGHQRAHGLRDPLNTLVRLYPMQYRTLPHGVLRTESEHRARVGLGSLDVTIPGRSIGHERAEQF